MIYSNPRERNRSGKQGKQGKTNEAHQNCPEYVQNLEGEEEDVEGPPARAVGALVAGLEPDAGQDVPRVEVEAGAIERGRENHKENIGPLFIGLVDCLFGWVGLVGP